MKEHTIFYNCDFCKQRVMKKIKLNSSIVKCSNPTCGKITLSNNIKSIVDLRRESESKIKANKRKDHILFLLISILLIIPITVFITYS